MEKAGKRAILQIFTRFLETCAPPNKSLAEDESKNDLEEYDKIAYQASKEEIITDSARIIKFLKASAKEKLDLYLDEAILQALKVSPRSELIPCFSQP